MANPTFVGAGTAPSAAGTGTGTTSVSPDVHASKAAGDLLLMVGMVKPFGTTVTGPAGWNLGGGCNDDTTASGVDTGGVRPFWFWKVSDGTETSATVTFGTGNTAWAQILCWRGYSDWYVQSNITRDPTTGTAWSAVFGVTTIQSGDSLVLFNAIPTDAVTGWTANAVSATGGTFTVTHLNNCTTTQGNQCGGAITYADCTAGPTTSEITYTATCGGTTTNARGQSILLVIKDGSLYL